MNEEITRTDLGNDLELITGTHGEVSVQPKNDGPMDAVQRQAYIDAAIEHSATPVELDNRHSKNPDFLNPDGSPAAEAETPVEAAQEAVAGE